MSEETNKTEDNQKTNNTDTKTTASTKKEEPVIPHFLDELNSQKDLSKVDFTNGDNSKTPSEAIKNYAFYPDHPENALHKYLFALKQPGQYYDPCEESKKMSFKCLERNQDDKYQCQEFFDAYKECKKSWSAAKRMSRTEWKK